MNIEKFLNEYFAGKKEIVIVFHGGDAHTDDIASAGLLGILLEKAGMPYRFIRSGDPEVIETADIAVDVSRKYDKIRYWDHHHLRTKEDGGIRENGIPRSSFGLLADFFGEDLCGSKEANEYFITTLAWAIDAYDNGLDPMEGTIEDFNPLSIGGLFELFKKNLGEEKTEDELFALSVPIAKAIIQRVILRAQSLVPVAEALKKAADEAGDKQYLILEEGSDVWKDIAIPPQFLYVLYPSKHGALGKWRSVCVPKAPGSFKNRKSFPKEWAGSGE